MRNRFGRRAYVVLVSVGVLLSSAALPSVATTASAPSATAAQAGDPVLSENASDHGQITSLLHRMTLEEKVGQLFVVEVYGRDAHNVSATAVAATSGCTASTRRPM